MHFSAAQTDDDDVLVRGGEHVEKTGICVMTSLQNTSALHIKAVSLITAWRICGTSNGIYQRDIHPAGDICFTMKTHTTHACYINRAHALRSI